MDETNSSTNYVDFPTPEEEEAESRGYARKSCRARRYLQDAFTKIKHESITEYPVADDDGEVAVTFALEPLIEEHLRTRYSIQFLRDFLVTMDHDANTVPLGYVYMLEAGDYVKIGRTTHPNQRIKTLKIQLPFPVRVLNIFPCEDPVACEAELHNRYRHYRSNGEWFEFDEYTRRTHLNEITHMTTSQLGTFNGKTQMIEHRSIANVMWSNEQWTAAFRKAGELKEGGNES